MGWHVPRLGDSPLHGECEEFDSLLVHINSKVYTKNY